MQHGNPITTNSMLYSTWLIYSNIQFYLLNAEKVMTMQKRPLRKLCPLPPHGHDLRFGLMHLMNDQRIKPLQSFPQVGELPPVAGKMLTMQNKNSNK